MTNEEQDAQALAEITELRALHAAWAQGTEARGDIDRAMELLGRLIARMDMIGAQFANEADGERNVPEEAMPEILRSAVDALNEAAPPGWISAAMYVREQAEPQDPNRARMSVRFYTNMAPNVMEAVLAEIIRQYRVRTLVDGVSAKANPKPSGKPS
jgi:hypothetical protein